ncbi:hypothetical protein SCUCBS95973_001324, partial [Sporothrix curviconia]
FQGLADEDDEDDDSGDDANDDELGPDEEYDREGLQSRYEAALLDQRDRVTDSASFAKYLHTQR